MKQHNHNSFDPGKKTALLIQKERESGQIKRSAAINHYHLLPEFFLAEWEDDDHSLLALKANNYQ